MKKKIITIGIIGIFLLTTLFCITTQGSKLSKTGDLWIKITKPENRVNVSKFIVVESEVSNPDDVDRVLYCFWHHGNWHGSSQWSATEPPYRFVWTEKSLKPGDGVIIEAWIYKCTPTEWNPIVGSGEVYVTIKKIISFNLINDFLSRFPLLEHLLQHSLLT